MTDNNTAQPVVQPAFDKEQFISEAAQKAAELAAEKAKVDEVAVAERVRSEIIDKITGAKPVDEDAPSWEKRGEKAPKSWDEVLTEAEARVEKKLTKKQQQELEQQNKKKEQEEEQKKKSLEDWNKIWNDQLDDLEKTGKIPKMAQEIKQKLDKGEQLTEEEKLDPGLQARFGVQKAAIDHKESNLKVAYYEHYQETAPPVAPVFGSSRTSTPRSTGGEFTYEEIRNARSYDELLAS